MMLLFNTEDMPFWYDKHTETIVPYFPGDVTIGDLKKAITDMDRLKHRVAHFGDINGDYMFTTESIE